MLTIGARMVSKFKVQSLINIYIFSVCFVIRSTPNHIQLKYKWQVPIFLPYSLTKVGPPSLQDAPNPRVCHIQMA